MRFDLGIMVVTVVLMILLVQGTQWLGNQISLQLYRKRGVRRDEV
jgi:ABC-type methionine transport system permease subunit